MPSRTGLIDVRKLICFKWLSFSFYMAFTTGQAGQRAPQKTTGLPLAGCAGLFSVKKRGGKAMLVVMSLFVYIRLYGPTTSWGEISQAVLFHQARRFLLRLQEQVQVTKYWRPSLLLLSRRSRCWCISATT